MSWQDIYRAYKGIRKSVTKENLVISIKSSARLYKSLVPIHELSNVEAALKKAGLEPLDNIIKQVMHPSLEYDRALDMTLKFCAKYGEITNRFKQKG